MTTGSILLIGRNTRTAHEVIEAHADRLSQRTAVDVETVRIPR